MIQRLLAAAVGLAILLPALIWGGQLAVEVIVAIAAVICVLEYAAMAFPTEKAAASAWMIACIAFVGGSVLHLPWLGVAMPASLVVVATLTLGTLAPGDDISRSADRVGRMLMGVAWITQLVWLALLRRLDHGLAWIFLVLAISWLGDTGGYFAGRFFGRTPLYPRISPKKTREGAVGGITLSVVGVFVVRAIGLPTLPPAHAVALGILLCTAGILGDLAESMLKRAYQVKDSGKLLPGHGGLLDRIDSVIFVAPLLFAYAGWAQGRG